jgi:hypothetical protein
MSLPLTTLASPPDRYNVDDSRPGITPQVYLNDQLNDCVIAARAHHNVRLAYIPGAPVLDISPKEIADEYHLEAGPFNLGIVLGKSLFRWRDHGWKAGGFLRKIESCTGPLSITGAGMLAGDATRDLDLLQLKTCIIQHVGVQVDLNLPSSITVNDKKTYGPDSPWTSTSLPPLVTNRHVMLFTGYDEGGFTGITWGALQYMTLAFLQKYYTGIYWVTYATSTSP